MRFDVIVLGVGAMGSAACYHLARRGVRVLGLEQFALGHAKGSSHGDVRLIRKAYFEEERYVPLLHRAYELWDELSARAGRRLLHREGLLIVGPEQGGMALPKLLQSAAKHSIPVELLAGDEIRRRYRRIKPPDGYRGVFEPGAGFLEVENCVLAHARAATEEGAIIRADERVTSWRADGSGVAVVTEAATYRAAKLVVAGGPWSATLLRELALPLPVKRIPQFWFDAETAWASGQGMPCFAFDLPEGFFYGFPRREGRGVKLAEYHPAGGDVDDAYLVDRGVAPADFAKLQVVIRRYLEGVSPDPIASSVCMYTMTPDENFLIDRHPALSQVALAAGFSGHGFKFASVVGEILADLALQGRTALPADFLRLRPMSFR